MQVVDARTMEAIPFANWALNNSSGQNIIAGEADENGGIAPGNFQGYSDSAPVVISAAGYKSTTVNASSAAIPGQLAMLQENSALPEFVFTVVKKAKDNPFLTLAIVAIIALAIVYRKRIFSILK